MVWQAGAAPRLRGLAGKIREGGPDFPLLYMVSFTATEIEHKMLPCQKSLLGGWY